MRLRLKVSHLASPDHPSDACAEILRLARLLGVCVEINVNGKWRIFALPSDMIYHVKERLASAQRENP